MGRDHLPGLLATLDGDVGAQAYLSAHGAVVVPCGDLASGHDVDEPAGPGEQEEVLAIPPGDRRLAQDRLAEYVVADEPVLREKFIQ